MKPFETLGVTETVASALCTYGWKILFEIPLQIFKIQDWVLGQSAQLVCPGGKIPQMVQSFIQSFPNYNNFG